jgi:hypothetical protein
VTIKPIRWSHTSLEHSKQCLRSYHEIRVLKNFKSEENEQLIWGNRCHKAFELALRDSIPLPEGMTLWQSVIEQFRGLKGSMLVEQEMAITEGFQPCDYWAKETWCWGKVDALWLNGSVAKAVDWKFGKRKPDSDQLALMALLVFHHYPEVQEVRTLFMWMKTLQKDREDFKRQDIPALWQRFIPDYHRLVLALKNDEWPPRTSGLCRKHCPVVTCSYNGNAHLSRGT